MSGRLRRSHQHLIRGFALPTVLIASIVMLMVLLVGVTSTSTTRLALQSQYYEQLAHTAGDAGIAYAKACLSANGGAPLWTNIKPLKPNTDCTGTTLSGVTCPDGITTFFNGSTPAICSVTIRNNVRSSFSIGLPTLDSDGNATTIPNTGFVQLLRASTGAAWRTYTQQTTQSAVVPNLCAGSTTQALGWGVAAITTGTSFPDSAAEAISLSTASLNPGSVYYRKDFNVTKAGSYTLSGLTNGTASMSIDSVYLMTANSTTSSTSVYLTTGCHTLLAQVINPGIIPSAAWIKASIKLVSTTIPLVYTDSTWRVTAGVSAHYSSPSYFQNANWVPVREIQTWSSVTPVWTTALSPVWNTTSGDNSAYWISTTHSYTSTANYPASSTTVFRAIHDVVLASPTTVKISYTCDDICNIYIDGNMVATSGSSGVSTVSTNTIVLSEGTHRFAASVLNGGLGPSGIIFAAVDSSGNVLTDTTATTWYSADAWYGTDPNPFTYDASFAPNPYLPSNPVKLLVVGGGGGGGINGGGGGGGGGVREFTAYNVTPGTYQVTVGTGGAQAATSSVPGSSGSLSQFGSIISIGGGGGASRDNGGSGQTGGSGGGGAGASASNNSPLTRHIGGPGIAGQGNNAGNGTASNLGASATGGGGGGAGGAGTNAASLVSGNGGAAYISSITGTATSYGGGAGGGPTGGGSYGTSGVNAGVNGNSATANRGGGGSGGAAATGGSGGSGIVIISYLTGSMTATGGSINTSGAYTYHSFLSSGTFTVTSIP